MYGFAEEGKAPEIFDSYEEAEKAAGKGDLRRGNIFAVNPEEVTEIEVPGELDVDALLAVAESGDTKQYKAILTDLKRKSPELAAEVMKAINHFDTITAKDPLVAATSIPQAKAELQQKLIQLAGPRRIKSFAGDVKANVVAPKEVNYSSRGIYETDANGVVKDLSGRTIANESNVTQSALNLDTYKALVEAKGGIVVPKYLDYLPQDFLDASLDYVATDSKERFAQATPTQRRMMIVSGEVKLNRLDARLLEREWQVLGLDPKVHQDIITQSEVLNAGPFQDISSEAAKQLPWRRMNLDPLGPVMATQKGNVITTNSNHFNNAMAKWLDGMLKKLNMGDTKILLVPRVEMPDGTKQVNLNEYPIELQDGVRRILGYGQNGSLGYTNLLGNKTSYIVYLSLIHI